MRKELFGVFFVGIFSLFSCSQSTQDRVEAAAENIMQKHLNDPSAYEPVETKYDSVFYNIFFEEDVREKLDELSALHLDLDTNLSDEESAQYELELAEGNYSLSKDLYNISPSSHSKFNLDKDLSEIEKAKENIANLINERKTIEKSIAECENFLKEKYRLAPESYHIGWQCIHTFRITLPNGSKTLFNVLFIIDKDLENLLIDKIITENDTDLYESVELLQSVLNVETLCKYGTDSTRSLPSEKSLQSKK